MMSLGVQLRTISIEDKKHLQDTYSHMRTTIPGPVKRAMGKVTRTQNAQIIGKKNVEIINLY